MKYVTELKAMIPYSLFHGKEISIYSQPLRSIRNVEMTSEHLQISGQDLLELKYKHPLELEVIMEMLEEAGEGYYLEEMEAFENPSEVA